jgi:hypothetical protein
MFLIPKYSSSSIDSQEITSISLLGNVHRRRWGWNPFDRVNDMTHIGDGIWEFRSPVEGRRLPELSGQYSVRLVINHNPRRVLKARPFPNTKFLWQLQESVDGKGLHNVNFTVQSSQEIIFRFDVNTMSLELIPGTRPESVEPVSAFSSFELNGFVWDSASMFEKFDTRLVGRSFVKQDNDHWTIDVPLLSTGGIDFRADGVYQFLISANGSEDYGFASLNDGSGTLVQGTGFSSSHGTSLHSGSTVRILDDGLYRFHLHSPTEKPSVSVEALDPTARQPQLLNQRTSFQILGSIFESDQFDPTNHERTMSATENPQVYELKCRVRPGFHTVNVAISSELFLDTMGLGCWLDLDDYSTNELHCITWHGKPHEVNVCFALNSSSESESELQFLFDSTTDRLSISVMSGDGRLQPVTELDQLSLVGDFDSPLEAWNPESAKNLMSPLSGGRFERVLELSAGKTYHYKYVGNRSPWAITFADYELDCFGYDFAGHPHNSGDPSLASLRRYGRLTSHGNPPPLEFTAMHSGPFRFYADLSLGTYSVAPYF